MGSSETEEGIVDCGVGCIVWVRRRNGSWWPGKILGPDELSTSHVMTPRSGTAVKLLGRDDASVDWYNLEKSKRVKAFRCGEFDDCIERAEASLGMPPKKREKYARREDAIIHALELERQLVGGKNGITNNTCIGMLNKSPDDTVRREVVRSSECFESKNKKQLSMKSHKALERLGAPVKEEMRVCGDVGQKGTQLSGDSNYSILPPRKRGLLEFGVSSSLLEHNTSPVVSSGLNKIISESVDGSPNKRLISSAKESLHHVEVSNNIDESSVFYPQPDSSSAFTSEGEKLGVPYHAAKKGRYGFHEDDSRHCLNGNKVYLPTTQTVISTSKLEESDCPNQDESCVEKTSGSTECTETDSCETNTEESDSGEDIVTISEGAASIELRPKFFRRSRAQVKRGSTSSEYSDDLSGADSHPCHSHTVPSSVGVSKWLLKGKRNNRGFAKRSLDPTYEENHFKRPHYMTTGPVQKKCYGANEANSLMKSSRVSLAGYGSRGGGTCWNTGNWGDLSWINSREEYLDPSYNNYHHLGGPGPSMLIEVDLKVQAGYKRQPVPLISLTSKKSGHAIVGHPVKVEVLDKGTVDDILCAVNDICPETLDDDSSLQPTWRTARRTTGARVPRHHPSSSSTKRNRNTRKATCFGQKAASSSGSLVKKKNTSQQPLPLDKKSLTKKSLRNITFPSNHQKIRTLSSIASQQKQSIDAKRGGFKRFQVDGLLIKQGSMPTVACIPVKLVFSRLNEDLVGRHP
ncbi:unnamed protein product [Cuscuta epithymum]|uniref:PWWP domain-containing protein n=1 Tax=Cuscuta epithymum TaxID=186058 RepID=A0AAV0FYR5_9ASTE|nr:unnamed protein product [Cuscuta epithymum]